MNMTSPSDESSTLINISEVLKHQQIMSLPGGEVAEEAYLLIKATDDDDEPTWYGRTTGGLSDEELLGTLVVQVELLKNKILSSWTAVD